MPEAQFISLREHDRLIREERARNIDDDEVLRMAERDGERLAVLEAELRHVREAQDNAARIAKEERAIMQAELVDLAKKVQGLTDVLTKASGMKMAFTLFGAGLMLIAAQFWNFLAWARPVILLAAFARMPSLVFPSLIN